MASLSIVDTSTVAVTLDSRNTLKTFLGKKVKLTAANGTSFTSTEALQGQAWQAFFPSRSASSKGLHNFLSALGACRGSPVIVQVEEVE